MEAGQDTFRTIVTLFEQYGAGAAAIAPRVAERLGVPYVAQMFSSTDLEDAAGSADEDAGPFTRLLMAISRAEADNPLWAIDQRAESEMVTQSTTEVIESTRNGGVIVGRNATIVLAKVPGALHVKLICPREERIERAAAEASIDLERARRRQEREDRVRAELSQRLYRWDPRRDEHYDLVVNTHCFDVDAAADLIVDAYRRRYPGTLR